MKIHLVLTCEKVGASDGSVNYFAKNDFKQFKKLFDYDFGPEWKKNLGIDCLSAELQIIRL